MGLSSARVVGFDTHAVAVPESFCPFGEPTIVDRSLLSSVAYTCGTGA
jgi:hypothetical protein